MEYGLIAKKLGHSFSREIHALIGDYGYEMCELREDELAEFMKKKDFSGINVTIPYKKDVLPYLDSINEFAERIGSVNTVVNRSGRLYGYNTDYFGMKALIEEHMGIKLEGKKVLILGTGGTSVTAKVVAEDLKAGEILTVSRTPKDGEISYSEATSKHADADVIINTTPVGMFPNNYACPIDLEPFYKLEAAVDAIYNPNRTEFVRQAEKKGAKASGGLYMLVAQAVYASEIFRDTTISKSEIQRIYREVYLMKENIVLTGMPACGKTTAGKLIAEIMNREFIDTDSEIVSRTGKDIPAIFAELGEKGFRDIETEVIKDVGKRSGIVIATGGGAVLRDENVSALKQNCKVFYIDRPIEWLRPTSDRPTASDYEAIKRRYGERHKRYEDTADVIIKPSENASETAEMIVERFKNEDSCY